MKKPVMIKKLPFGGGKVSICVPMVGRTCQEILEEAEALLPAGPDLVEWRGDFFEGIFDRESCRILLQQLEQILGEIPLLFTFRSQGEGGELPITAEAYTELNLWMAAQTEVAAVDVEALRPDLDSESLIRGIRERGKVVFASNHHFQETPSSAEMRAILAKEEELGADVLKMAVMPKTGEDVLRLLQITWEMDQQTDKPVVTMSMGPLGGISRVAGHVTGSCMSFGTVGRASAPGQLPVAELRRMLELL